MKKISQLTNVNFSLIEKDIQELKKVVLSTVVLYKTSKRGVKVFYGPFITKSLFSKFNHMLRKDTVQTYRQYFLDQKLPDLFFFAIRYMNNIKSIRTDFLYRSYNIEKYIHNFDDTLTAYKLYNELKQVGNIRLLGISLDLDRR